MDRPDTPTRRASRPHVAVDPESQAPWPLPGPHNAFQTSPVASFAQVDASAIDPQLSAVEGSIETAANSDRQLNSLSAEVSRDIIESASPFNNSSQNTSSAITGRDLPSKDISDDILDDTYVSFIMYCNPVVPADTDTLELRKAFRSPPRSDGKNFSTFTLFELIRKLELKEIKTWAQLALELGVEPPAAEKGQSAQKVQQYAVRLKRWMHAMHVDAFFEYLLGKSHNYWTKIPSITDPAPEFGRDGVLPEEDLALRALLPETRPKRGRRKADDRDRDREGDLGKSPAQRPRLHSPTLSEDFAMARASILEDITPSTGRPDWSTTDARISFTGNPAISVPQYTPLSSEENRWNQRDSYQNNFIPHPQSAITPRTANPFLPYDGEPQSAITPSASRSRRRHGPAVSSAWPSNSNFPASKLRGRPPSNRSISNGPFSTFPANPNAKAGPTINLRSQAFPSAIVADKSDIRTPAFNFPDVPTSSRAQATRPSRLHLEVPERVGGAVRLATPPPTVLVNGESEVSQPYTLGTDQDPTPTSIMDHLPSAYLAEQFARDLVPPNEDEELDNGTNSAKKPSPTNKSFRIEPVGDKTNIVELEFMFIHTILCAEWFDHNGLSIEKCSLEEADQIVKQVIRNLREEASSKETFLINLAALSGGDVLRSRPHFLKMTRLEVQDGVRPFIAKWALKFGPVEGLFDIKIMVPNQPHNTGNADDVDQGPSDALSQEDWKQKCMELRTRIKERDEKVRELTTMVLDALIASQRMGI